MSDNIPFHIQMKIIKWVHDVKSLIRFRSVSKSWKYFIDSSEFIAGYGAHDTQPHRLLLRYKEAGDPHEVKYLSFADDISFPQQQDFALNVPLLIKQLKNSKVIGNSCGLWCLHGYNSSETEMVAIWNPSIKKSVGIVVPCELTNTSGKLNHFGFGVCPSTCDPTIVGISWYFRKNQLNIMWQVGIFTLSSKTWKMIPTSNVLRESIRLRSSSRVAIDRFIYWISNDRNVVNDDGSNYKNLILSFDLITHEFKEINLPRSLANRWSLHFSISQLSESLVVAAYTNVNGLLYEVWMMGEVGGVGKSFTKLFTINTPCPSIKKLLGFRKSSEPIMETITEDKKISALELYEPCSEYINNLGIYGGNGSFFICPYTDALLLIDHSDGGITSNNHSG